MKRKQPKLVTDEQKNATLTAVKIIEQLLSEGTFSGKYSNALTNSQSFLAKIRLQLEPTASPEKVA